MTRLTSAWQWLRGRPVWVWGSVGALTVAALVAAVLLWPGGEDDTATPAATTTRPATSTTSSTTTTRPPTTTTPTTTTRSPTTARPTTTTKVPAGPVPGIVVASAGSAGGSGEVQVIWTAAERATGYRVHRTDSAGRNARLMADIDIVTGHTRAEAEVVYLRSDEHTYVPGGGPLTRADRSSRFQYIDYDGGNTRCHRVQAYNAAGPGPLSAVTCGSPVTGPPPSLPS